MELIDDEMINVLTLEKRKVCQTCHKVKIRKKFDLDGFTQEHLQNNICICHTQQKHHQHQITNINQRINPIDQNNVEGNNDIQNNQSESGRIIKPSDEEDFNGEKESQNSYQNQRDNSMNNEQNIRQNPDDNEFVTKRDFRNLCERIERGFKEINEKLDKKADK